ncbi:hypothetical protein DBV33_11590 [Pseudomonas fluorescens]|nr:hypothetical protein DBV33_11590 [Pseudomonas fluorescens]
MGAVKDILLESGRLVVFLRAENIDNQRKTPCQPWAKHIAMLVIWIQFLPKMESLISDQAVAAPWWRQKLDVLFMFMIRQADCS